MSEVKKDYVGELLIVTLILLSGSVVFNIQATGSYSTCTNGVWTELNATHYQCSSNQKVQICHHLSSTAKTCYLGVIVSVEEQTPTNPINSSVDRVCGEYRCFGSKGYCYGNNGDISQPRVLISDACK